LVREEVLGKLADGDDGIEGGEGELGQARPEDTWQHARKPVGNALASQNSELCLTRLCKQVGRLLLGRGCRAAAAHAA
jgi:hypothetical protein